MTVLVVDDNADCAESTATLLGMFGYNPLVARDGEEGLNKIINEEPDVVLLDVNMPGMSGYDLADRLKEVRLTKPPFIVVVSANAYAEDVAKSQNHGIYLHLAKPVNPTYLRIMLERFRRVVQ